MANDADSSQGSAEHARMATDPAPWRRWGPYLAERQWGTVREDYSPGGTAWKYLPHDHARSRAYRWGEDGIAGFSDDRQHLCLSLALWNGKDPILKERMFGLDNEEGNHGEDVKELWYFSDAVPSHAYLKMLYKYPQREYPYRWLVEENARRGTDAREFELLDTGIFDDDRYFDVEVEYAKAGPDDILMLVTAHNRGPEAAELVLLPTLTCRNIWSWKADCPRPRLSVDDGGIAVAHPQLGAFRCDIAGSPELLFCDNDTNVRRLFGVESKGFFKDAFHDRVVHGDGGAVNPERIGTKAAALHRLTIPAGGSATVRLRLRPAAGGLPDAWVDFDGIVAQRRREADAFYAQVQVGVDDADRRLVQRQAYAGMIWSKQLFLYDVDTWLTGDPLQPPPPPGRARGRNRDWRHVEAADIISMPDTWEYPWFASWDLAFHCVALADIDREFAKAQMLILLGERYLNRNGQLPAYEWAFGDANPPVHAWAAYRVFQIDRRQRRGVHADDAGDLGFLRRVMQKLLLNFSWWVNRKDEHGRNIYQGGFLGLDNIGCFDRGKALPTGGTIDQADGTSWMAMYSLNLLRIAIELALHDHVYEELATTFFDHFLAIAQAINGKGMAADEHGDGTGLWDEGDGFYYDRLRLPDGGQVPLRIQSIVGLIPLLAVEVLEPDVLQKLPGFAARLDHHLKQHPELADLISNWTIGAEGDRRLLSLLRGHRMKALLRRMLDSTQFLSDHGVRSLSKVHEAHPFRLEHGGQVFAVPYWPAESRSRLFGGNSNWRGPVWMPLNYLLIESLQKFHHYYGDDFRIECPAGSGKYVTILEVSQELSNRLVGLFTKGGDGQRPVLKIHPKLSGDPRFRDHVLFHEYFDGDSGRGVGAAHQTGWTGLIARLVRKRRPISDPPSASHHTPQQGTKP